MQHCLWSRLLLSAVIGWSFMSLSVQRHTGIHLFQLFLMTERLNVILFRKVLCAAAIKKKKRGKEAHSNALFIKSRISFAPIQLKCYFASFKDVLVVYLGAPWCKTNNLSYGFYLWRHLWLPLCSAVSLFLLLQWWCTQFQAQDLSEW